MQKKIVKFNPNGGPLTDKVICGYAQSGSYDFLLWTSDGKTTVAEKSGNFLPGDPCSIILPTPLKDNDGKILECISTVSIIPPLNNYNITLAIYQDGNQLDEVNVDEGTATSSEIDSDLLIQLTAGNS